MHGIVFFFFLKYYNEIIPRSDGIYEHTIQPCLSIILKCEREEVKLDCPPISVAI